MKATPLWVLGMMSGTSLDGVDAALVRTDGSLILEVGESAYRPYSEAEREVIRAGFGQWPGGEHVTEAARVAEMAHAELARAFEQVDYIGFHGQTLAHDPANGRTHQAGDGDALANTLNTPVIWDFRSNDVQMGGEGAPLAPVYHFAMIKSAGLTAPAAVLNLGGVGNLTLVDPRYETPQEEGALLAFDTGPANAPLNDLMLKAKGVAFDEGGAFARSGTVADVIVERFKSDGYFRRIPPKSLDRDSFAWVSEACSDLAPKDAAATLVEIAAQSVALGLEHAEDRPNALYVTGGGRHNTYLMERLAALTALDVLPVEDIGFDGDMVEAQAFAFLAARVLFGLPTSFPSTTGVAAAIGGGQISRP